ncbi:hypothetical protein AXX12_03045 [Anaerosporomusa subterranea]|jgi:hypothetical protein|uniref:Uncharacterized protein n=1 Tax=Anaerosporomusa subterranea TaxID=1794912 RepID=A0A154BT29_ANASB|nr:YlzJ-like family protein [Anaerosporomusa subterranea]KYZ77126.1 hypothetical protein AXX12_03045 [Anaerosporomusa subterranea]
MILWTIMPEELVFGQESYVDPYEEIEFAGAKMMVEKIAANQCRIVRIISTDPQDYLRSDLQPGVVLTAKNRYELLS